MSLTSNYSSLPEAPAILPGIPGVDDGTASDKSDHNPDGLIDDYQEADGQDRGTEPISKGAVQADAHLIYRPLHYLNSTVTISDPPKSLIFAAADRIPGSQSSHLLGLPIEIQQLIYNNLNTTSLLRFSRVSRVTLDIVATFPAWRHLSDHSRGLLAAMSKMKLLRRHTVAELYETLSSARCVGCPSRRYGAHVFLPTTDRCCWVCISYHPMFRVISLRKASKTFAISISRIKRELYVFQSIPGVYDEGWQVSLAPHKLVCAREAGELGLRVHGSVDKLRTAADVFLRDVNPPYRREATYLQSAVGAELGKVSPWTWAPSTNMSSSQTSLSEVAIFDENFGKAVMLVSRFCPGVGVEQPLWCKGCCLVLEAYENQTLSDEFILENIVNEKKELDLRHGIGNLDLGDILRCLAKQARSPGELYDHAKYCYGARKMLWDAGSQVRLFVSEPSIHGSRNPLDLSTIVDSGGCAHIVNDLSLLEQSSLIEANDDDFIVSGGRRIKVVFRGRRIMKGLLDGQHGSQRQDLVLENVACVPGFDSNIISSSVLKKDLGYWVCGYDNTLRSGSYENPRILLQLPEISNVTVAEYKEDPEYILSLVGQPYPRAACPKRKGILVVTDQHRDAKRSDSKTARMVNVIGNDEVAPSRPILDIRDRCLLLALPRIGKMSEKLHEPHSPLQATSTNRSNLGRRDSSWVTNISEHREFVLNKTRKVPNFPRSLCPKESIEKHTQVLNEGQSEPDTNIFDRPSIRKSSLCSPLRPRSQSCTQADPNMSYEMVALAASAASGSRSASLRSSKRETASKIRFCYRTREGEKEEWEVGGIEVRQPNESSVLKLMQRNRDGECIPKLPRYETEMSF